jgi:hypothetical protein
VGRYKLGRVVTQLTLYGRNGYATLYEGGTGDNASDRDDGGRFDASRTLDATELHLRGGRFDVRTVFREQEGINTQPVS